MTDPIVRFAVAGAAVHLVATAVAVADEEAFGAPFVVVSLALFGLGIAAFVRTMLRVANRSRTEVLSVGGIWFLTDAPTPVKRALLGVLAFEVVVAVAGASIRPYTALAFGIFAPVHGLGMCGLWSADRGTFPKRQPGARRTD